MSTPITVPTILYVEDEDNIRNEMSEVLELFCDTLYLAENGQKGLELYKTHLPSIVVSDIRMPKMDGIDMAKAILELNPNTHIIFTTAFSDNEYMQQAITLQADAYLIKPLNLEQLENVVTKTARRYLLEREVELKTKQEQKIKEELETILITIHDGIAIIDSNSQHLYCNQAYSELTGYTQEELLTRKADNTIEAHHLNKLKIKLQELINKQQELFLKTEFHTPQGQQKFVQISLKYMPDNQRILLVAKDISEKQRKQAIIAEHLKVIDQNVISLSTDLEGMITQVSSAFGDTLQYPPHTFIGQHISTLYDSNDHKTLHEAIWKTLTEEQKWSGEIKHINREGSHFYLKTKMYSRYNEHHKLSGYNVIMNDITHLKNIEELSITDELTGLYNRRQFNHIFPAYLASSQRHNTQICFGIIDIDHFKHYNDFYGHQPGDVAIQKVANTLIETLRRTDDYCFRLGGEEFGVLFTSKPHSDPEKLAQKLINAVKELKILHEKSKVSKYLTISLGLWCSSNGTLPDADTLYKQTDELLYQAKELGRNRFVLNAKED